MTFLELLARPAPAGVIAAELLLVRDGALARCDRGGARAYDSCGRAGSPHSVTRSGGLNGVGAGERLVLVRESAVPAAARPTPWAGGLLQVGGSLRLHFDVEEIADDLFADDLPKLFEHRVALGPIFDERVLLGHGAQVDAVAQVIHRVQVLAPANIDDLEDQEPLDLAHELGAELLLLRFVRVARVVLELADQLGLRHAEVELDGLDAGVVEVGHLLEEAVDVPFLLVLGGRVLHDDALDQLVDPVADVLREVLALENASALLVDHLALDVHDVVVLEDVLARDEVLLLDLLLGILDLVREDLALHRLVVGQVEAVHDLVDPVAREQPDEVVLRGEIEAGFARIALTPRAAAQLVVDAPRLMALGSEDVQAPRFDDSLAELDVDSAAGHVGRDRDCAGLAGANDDLRLALVLLRIQDVMRDALSGEELGEVLGNLDGDRADEDRLALLVALLDVLDGRVVLRFLRLVDEVVGIVPDDRDVGRDLGDREVVDLLELLLLGLGRTSHAGELLVEAEVVLERDRRERDMLLLDRDAFLRLDGLVEPLRPAPAFHDPAGELVDDLHLAVLDHVVDVALVERLRLERLDEVIDELRVLRRVEVFDPERALDRLDCGLPRRHGLELLVELVVRVVLGLLHALGDELGRDARQAADDAREVVVGLRRRLGLARDDERRARLVDEDRVDFVHDRVRVAALNSAFERRRHVVAEVVETELRVRPVDDVRLVGGLALVEGHHVADVARPHAELLVHGPHPLGIALGQVVVDRDEVDAASLESVEVERHRRHERLSLTGLHLGDVAFVKDDRAHELHVERAEAERALGGLADSGVGLEDERVEVLPVLQPLLELDGFAGELLCGQGFEVGLERRDVRRLLGELLQATPLAHAKNALQCAVVLGH